MNCLVFFFAWPVIVVSQAEQPPMTAPKLHLSCSSDKNRYTAKDSVTLTIALKNSGKKELWFCTKAPLAQYQLQLVGPDGKEVPLTEAGKAELETSEDGSCFWFFLKPDKEDRCTLSLKELYSLHTPGKYLIRLSTTLTIQEKEVVLSAKAIEIEIAK